MKLRPLFALPLVLAVAACGNAILVSEASAPRAGFTAVERGATRALGQTPGWHLTPAEVEANAARVAALVQGKTINADTAVKVALLNNRGLQAAYADLGLSAADLWEVARGPVPTLDLSVSGLMGDATRSFEASLVASLFDLVTSKPKSEIAELRFRRAELKALGETLALATETRRAWIEAVGAFEAAALIGESQNTAEAASELAMQLGRTGAMNAADQAREFAFAAELAAEQAEAKLEAQLAKEQLIRQMGLWGSDTQIYVPDALPALPARPRAAADIEAQALRNRVDLAAGRLELEIVAQEYRLSGQTRMISDVTLAAGGEVERSDGVTERSPTLDLQFEIPLYDSSALTSKRGQMAYLRAANTLAQQAIDARAEARIAHRALTGRHAIARQWRDEVLPLRQRIDAEALLSYNGMLTSPFDLLEDARDGLEARLSAARAKQDYWRAETDVVAAIWGGPVTASRSEGETE